MARSRWRPWAWPSELRRRDVLGMNRRNASYVLASNPRRHYPRVDDKLATKRICQRQGIPVPQTFAVIERQGDVRRFADLIGDHQEFVVKPTGGSEGRGIVVIVQRQGEALVTVGDEKLSMADLRYHLSAVLAGLYSLGGQPDRAVVEQRIVRHPAFETIAVGGTPDLRIVLYRGVPAMAMVRLPTRASRGRANLHQGAVGAGVRLQDGETFGGVCNLRAVHLHPDTGQPIAGLKIPHWEALLRAAMKLTDSLEMGYVGVDFVLDATDGPVVLEANARPGLAIQLANGTGLLRRLQLIDAQRIPAHSHADRMELAARLAEI
jgi:alpha-L-glutamate ligase-like protein